MALKEHKPFRRKEICWDNHSVEFEALSLYGMLPIPGFKYKKAGLPVSLLFPMQHIPGSVLVGLTS